MTSARLIVEGHSTDQFAYTGVENMAIDETLLHSAAELGITTLRFYGWRPATLSLGYFQRFADRQLHGPSQSCELVRRASGGGAIIHDVELTYCFAAPSQKRFGDAEEYYAVFHETLVELLAIHGIASHRHEARRGSNDEPFLCFQRRAKHDVICADNKICGSAQRRWKSGLVQHGSVLLAKSEYAPELPGLRELAGFDIDPLDLANQWLKKLASRLNLKFEARGLADKEKEHGRQLASDKFSTPEWNQKR